MTEHENERDPIEQLADEFVQRIRLGENPSLTEYAERHPALAQEIRDLFPALVVMERLGPQPEGLHGEVKPTVTADGKITEQLGDYRILREVGRGGMGVVYEAEQVSLGRHVALKVLPFHALMGGNLLKRFQLEARAAARLHHTNIVPVFGVGEHDGVHYYAMQFIQGLGLDEVLDEVRRLRGRNLDGGMADPETGRRPRQPLSQSIARGLVCGHLEAAREPRQEESAEFSSQRPEHAPDSKASFPEVASARSTELTGKSSDNAYFRSVARMGEQVAEALAYAHRQGVLHRDIKPSNLLLDAQGVVWVTDFGLAKATPLADDGDELTQSGDIVGTITYMAPERLSGQSDARSDVYGLGVTLYELLTLRPAFKASDRALLIKQIAHEEPPGPRSVAPRIPRDLETIVLKAMEKDPGRRYQRAAELAEDLRRFLGFLPIRARRTSHLSRLGRWCQRNPGTAALTASVLILMLVIAAGASATAWRLRDHLDRAVLAENKAQARLYASLRAQAQASRWSGRPGRRFHSLEAIAEASSLVPQLGLGSAAIADLRNQAIASLTLADAKLMGEWEGYPTGSSWLAVDGDLERYARSDEHGNISVRRVSDDQELAQLPGNGLGTEFLRFNADGDLLTAVYWNRRQSSNISVWNWRDRAILFQAPFLSNSTPDFTPDGGVLAVGHESGEIVLYELASGLETKRIPCAPRPLKLAFDPSGTRIAVSSGSKAVQVFDLAGNRLHEFPHPHTVASLAWHPQGRLLAVGCEDANIYLWNLTNGRQHAMLQGHQATVVGIDFTSNGEIMLSWSWDTTSRLWDPWTGALRLTCPGTLGGLSHDGRRMVSTQGNSMSLWEVDPGREYRSLPNYGTAAGDRLYYHDGSISHDGRWLAMGCEDGVRLWDLARWEQVAALPVGRTVNALFHPADWELFFSGNGLYRMALDSDEGALHVTQPSPIAAPGTFQHLGIDAHGLILAASNNRGVWLLDPVNPSEQPPFLEHPGAIFASVSPDGRWIASSTWHGSGVKVWDASSAQPVQHLLPGMNPIYASFSRGGKWLMTSGTSEFCCWEVDTWRQVWRIPRKGGITNRVAWTTDGRLMAIVSSALVHLLDPASGRVFATLEPPNSDLVNWLGFTPDGTRLVVSSSQSSRIRVWDLQLIRIHLAPMGLDWDLPAYASPSLPETR